MCQSRKDSRVRRDHARVSFSVYIERRLRTKRSVRLKCGTNFEKWHRAKTKCDTVSREALVRCAYDLSTENANDSRDNEPV